MPVRHFRQGIVPPPSVLAFTDAAAGDAPVDLTNATEVDASFYALTGSGKALLSGWPKRCTITAPTAGQVTVAWSSSDVAVAGDYQLQAVATFSNGAEPSIIHQDIHIDANDALGAQTLSPTLAGITPSQFAAVSSGNEVLASPNGSGGTPTFRALVAADVPPLPPSQITGTAVITSDSRLSDARTPTAHASTHGAAGSDPLSGLTAAQIASVNPSALTGSGTVPSAALALATPGLAGILRRMANNVLDYGADPTGTTDSTTAIQNALNATNFGAWSSSAAPLVIVPAGTYLISNWLVAKPGTVILGLGHPLYNGARIKQANGTNIAGPGGTLAALIVTPNWLANTVTAADAPVVVENLCLDGNMANNPTSTVCGLILMSFWSRVTGCHVLNTPLHGIVLTDTTQNGTVLQDTPSIVTAGETRIERNKVEAIGGTGQIGHGIYVQRTDASGVQHVNDCFAERNLVSGCSGDNIRVESAGGWLIAGNHCYSAMRNGIYTAMGFGTRILDNYVETFGGEGLPSGSGGFYDGIAALNIQGSQSFPGYGVQIRGNHIGCYEGTNGSLYSYVHVGAGSGQTWADATVEGNIIGARVLATSYGYGIHVQSNSTGVLKVRTGGNSIHNVYQRLRVDTSNDIVIASSEGGEQRSKPTTVTANYTALGADSTILVDAANKTITLPAPMSDHFPYQNGLGIAPPGRRYTIANTANGAGTTIATAGGTIGGLSTFSLPTANTGVTVETDGTNWVVLGGTGGSTDASVSATRIETVGRLLLNAASGISNGFVYFAYFTPTQNLTVSSLLSACRGTAAVGATLAKLGLYTVDGSNNLTCVARSANVASSGANIVNGATNVGLWSSANHLYTTPIVDNGAASPSAISSYSLVTGQRYALGLLIVGATTLPQLDAVNMGVGDVAFQSPILATVSGSGQTDLAASYTAGSVSGNGALFYGALT